MVISYRYKIKEIEKRYSFFVMRTLRIYSLKRIPIGIGMQSRKSRYTQNNRQVWPWSTKWSRAKANRVLLGEHSGHSKHPFPKTEEKTLHMDTHQMVNTERRLIMFFAVNVGEALYSRQKQEWQLSWLLLRSWGPYWKIQA